MQEIHPLCSDRPKKRLERETPKRLAIEPWVGTQDAVYEPRVHGTGSKCIELCALCFVCAHIGSFPSRAHL